MLSLGKLELTNALMVIYLKGGRLESLFTKYGTPTNEKIVRIGKSLKKYLGFLKQHISQEKIPSHQDLLNMDYDADSNFFDPDNTKKDNIEELRFILLRIGEAYGDIYHLPNTEICTKNDNITDNIQLGLGELTNKDIPIELVVSAVITIIKEVENFITNDVGFTTKHIISKLALNIDNDKVLAIVSKVLALSKRI